MSVRIELWRPDPARSAGDLDQLARVLHACVHKGASVSFVLPFSVENAESFWRDKVFAQVEAETCRLFVARAEGRIVGTVQLDIGTPPNQPHRAEVRKLLVDPEARRQGIAKALMLAIEEQARKDGRTLLTLDTVTGGFAEPLYLAIGYVKIGAIPRYAIRPDSPELDATSIMYKEL